MPNPYFQFKKFTIYHDRCAMKVGTDGVLLGAWVNVTGMEKVLDVGTGTGLVALMMAQRNSNLSIDAIDIDTEAIGQAKENVKNSPFQDQIKCYSQSLQDFSVNCNQKYDLIVSNPPYFVQSLKSPENTRTLARHTDSLPIGEFIKISSGMLSVQGRIALVYPHNETGKILSFAEENGLYVSEQVNVFPKPDSLPKRILIELVKEQVPMEESSLTIEKDRHIYSDEFVELVKNYYLKL